MSDFNKIITLGIGCRRGVPYDAIAVAVSDVLDRFLIKKESISFVASVDLKADEAGLLMFADKWNFNIIFFPKDELMQVEVANPSEIVVDKIGIPSVSEAAALLSANQRAEELGGYNVSSRLIVEKQKYGNITIAVAELILSSCV